MGKGWWKGGERRGKGGERKIYGRGGGKGGWRREGVGVGEIPRLVAPQIHQ